MMMILLGCVAAGGDGNGNPIPAPISPNVTSCCSLLRTPTLARFVAECLGWPGTLCGHMHHARFHTLGSDDVLRCLEFATTMFPHR